MQVDPTSQPRRVSLAKESELRVEVSDNSVLTAAGPNTKAQSIGVHVKLLSGSAEVFGAELAEGQTYFFGKSKKFAVFTWYGCELQISGSMSSAYTSDETPMMVYVNLHQRLEALRREAKAKDKQGPMVAIVGPTDAGKSSLVRLLATYACRLGNSMTVVDLDLGQGDISIPGTVAATPIDRECVSVEHGFTHTIPLVYYTGAVRTKDNIDLFRHQVSHLSSNLIARFTNDAVARQCGAIINTMGWIDGDGYPLLLDCIRRFNVDVVVVVGHDKLQADLTRDVASMASKPTVVKVPRSGGAVERLIDVRKASRMQRIREYFFGRQNEFSPHSTTVNFDDVTILKVGGTATSSKLIPFGKQSALNPLRSTPVLPSVSMLNHVLAVSRTDDAETAAAVPVAGFVHVQAVDVEARTLTLLAPNAAKFPSSTLLLGNVIWSE